MDALEARAAAPARADDGDLEQVEVRAGELMAGMKRSQTERVLRLPMQEWLDEIESKVRELVLRFKNFHWKRFRGDKMKFVVLIVTCAASAMAQTAPGKAVAMQPSANLAQLMRGIIYPSSNVIFAAQTQNPAEIKPAADPAMSPNLLTSAYGKWDAVENSSLALAEAASLLTISGRKCSNGVDVPLKDPDWPKLVQALRRAGLAAYKAAQTRNQEKIVDAANDVTTACENCHEKYREKPNLSARCK